MSRISRSKRHKTNRGKFVAASSVIVVVLALAALYAIWHAGGEGGSANPPKQQSTGDSGGSGGSGGKDQPVNGQHPDAEPSSDGASPGEDGQIDDVDAPLPADDAGQTDSVLLALVGDVMLAGNVGKMLERNGYDYPYKYVGSYLQQADIAIGNLENPISERGEPADKQFVFRASPRVLPELSRSGFDIFSLANNHTLDYGWEALADTRHHLSQGGLHHIGSGVNTEEAYTPVMIEKNGVRVASLAFSRVVPDGSWKATAKSPGLADTYDYRPAVDAIARAKEQADVVVVMVHWGLERKDEPEPYQRDLAKRYIDAGADLIVGSHAHVLQGIESYKGKWVAYSMGNFIFTVHAEAGKQHTAILQADCGKSGDCELRLVPFALGVAQPAPVDDEQAAALFARLSDVSYNAVIDETGRVVSLTGE